MKTYSPQKGWRGIKRIFPAQPRAGHAGGRQEPAGRSREAGISAAAGFTLLEVLVAVVILGLAYVALLQNFSLSLRNIVRVDESRRGMFEQALLFEEMLHPPDPTELEAGEEGGLMSGPVFLEGGRFQLVIVSPVGGDFMSLQLERF